MLRSLGLSQLFFFADVDLRSANLYNGYTRFVLSMSRSTPFVPIRSNLVDPPAKKYEP